MKIQDIAYVLHRKPYRENQYLVEFFTKNNGILHAVARGRARTQAPLECFRPFFIEYNHKNNLATLYQYQPESSLLISNLEGKKLYCGFYINELLIKLLGQDDPYIALFDAYSEILLSLEHANNQIAMEIALRQFELLILREVGYGVLFEEILNSNNYQYHAGSGFVVVQEAVNLEVRTPIFSGQDILAFAQNNWENAATLKSAKYLMRLILQTLISTPLKSRSLFVG